MEHTKLTVVSNVVLSQYLNALDISENDYIVCRSGRGNNFLKTKAWLTLPNRFLSNPVFVYEIDAQYHYRECLFVKEDNQISISSKSDRYYVVLRKQSLPNVGLLDVLKYNLINKYNALLMKLQLKKWNIFRFK